MENKDVQLKQETETQVRSFNLSILKDELMGEARASFHG